ncbi:hypothetical protein [Bacillus changyiensis]|uniref:hypothetical protein n=1 Tax=Bacillus changyiensis TaxID=3004103 RepID=UPI0022E7CABA|nr:hypothetical protein [Bacillus changyiensis]MDA1477174.1 hypothetical protein [Bacillus changyiensis]
MLKNKKRKVIVSTLILGLILSISAIGLAYSKGYSFNIRSSVTGSYKFNLNNKSTTITANADTINVRTGRTLSDKHQYTVYLEKNWSFESRDTGQLTTGSRYTKNVGKVSGGDYRIKVIKHTYSDYGINIKGGGNVIQ